MCGDENIGGRALGAALTIQALLWIGLLVVQCDWLGLLLMIVE